MIVTIHKLDKENAVLPISDEILQQLDCKVGDSFDISVVKPSLIVLMKQPRVPQAVLDAAIEFFGGDAQAAFLFLLKLSVEINKETSCSNDDFTQRALELIARLERGVID